MTTAEKNAMENPILFQLLCLLGGNVDSIQICFDDRWDDYDEVDIFSPLLNPYHDWYVRRLGAELSSYTNKPVVRISISGKRTQDE